MPQRPPKPPAHSCRALAKSGSVTTEQPCHRSSRYGAGAALSQSQDCDKIARTETPYLCKKVQLKASSLPRKMGTEGSLAPEVPSYPIIVWSGSKRVP